ncbi:hypothetical protein ABEI56_08575 [Peribacillus castrilensis]|uniref:hypothetical protein n=1 Tax=Peribacillus TaxID=2675229 RepID=UPI0038715DC4
MSDFFQKRMINLHESMLALGEKMKHTKAGMTKNPGYLVLNVKDSHNQCVPFI